MKITKKIIALILTLAIGFSVCAPAADAAKVREPQNFNDYRQLLDDHGYPALSSAQFIEIIKRFNFVVRFFTGRGFVEPEHFNFVMDEMLMEISKGVADESGFDVALIGSNLPEGKQLAVFVTEVFNIDPSVLRDKFYEKRFAYDAEDNHFMGSICYFLGIYFSVIEECKAYCVPTDEENVYEVYLKITTKDGFYENIGTGMMINTETSTLYGRDNNGFMGLGFNFNYEELLVYTMVDVWMRDFGFTVLYDLFCYTTPLFFYDTRRIKFDYDGLEWMIQIWKGNYLVSNGAEVGIYSRQPGSIGTYYDCANDEQMMNMSMKVYHGDDLILERPEQLHWWVTGFKVSDTLYPANHLTLDFTIEMQSEEMLTAFCEAINKHYRGDIKYTVDGLKVNVIW